MPGGENMKFSEMTFGGSMPLAGVLEAATVEMKLFGVVTIAIFAAAHPAFLFFGLADLAGAAHGDAIGI